MRSPGLWEKQGIPAANGISSGAPVPGRGREVHLDMGETRPSGSCVRYAVGVPEPDREEVVERTEDGVDVTLIRWMLSLTPAERLQFLEDRVREVLAIRELNARK
jgi:hypothetical protein